MNTDSWSCLMVQKGPGVLSDKVCAALKAAACSLHLKGRDRMPLAGLLDGVIETNWTSHLVGMRSGILFRSQFDWENGGCKVNFLLTTEDLKRGAEVIREIVEGKGAHLVELDVPIPVEELYRFYDLRVDRRLQSTG